MKKLKRCWKLLLTILYGAVVFLLCLFPYRAVMNYHEQTHLFRWTWSYIQEQTATASGWWELAVSFITQFFYVGWLGALVMALMAVLLQQLIWRGGKFLFSKIKWQNTRITTGLFLFSLIPGLLLFWMVFIPKAYKTDERYREAVEYDYLVRSQQWESILRRSYNHPPLDYNGIWCTNYALAKKGMLLEQMFYYEQDGPDGLLMDNLRMQPIALFSLSDIFFHLGMVNTAERFAFDVRQQLPDMHKSGRIYQRLAEVNLINGQYAVARKYLRVLRPTLFYREWAEKYLSLLENTQAADFKERYEQLLNADATYRQLRKFRQQSNDELASDKTQILTQLTTEHPENALAQDYLMALGLLKLNNQEVLDNTLRRMQTGWKPVPKAVQESIAGYWILSHPNDSLPIAINKDIFYTTMQYIQTVNSTGNLLDASLDVPPYSESYWHYHNKATVKLKQQK